MTGDRSPPLTVVLDGTCCDPAAIGGKGAALDRLIGWRVRVPDTGVVTADAYRSVATQPGPRRLLAALAAGQEHTVEEIDRVSGTAVFTGENDGQDYVAALVGRERRHDLGNGLTDEPAGGGDRAHDRDVPRRHRTDLAADRELSKPVQRHPHVAVGLDPAVVPRVRPVVLGQAPDVDVAWDRAPAPVAASDLEVVALLAGRHQSLRDLPCLL